MSDSVIRQVLESQLKVVCDSLSPKLLIAFQNVAFTPKVCVPYAQCYVLPAKTEDPSIGDKHSRKTGIFQVSLNFPVNGGSTKIEATKDSIENFFYRGRSFEKNGKWLNVDSTPSSTSASVQNGWYVMHISIDYRMEVFR